MKYLNLTKVEAFQKLLKDKPFNVKEKLTKDRINSFQIRIVENLVYNYAAMPVNEKILQDLQDLAEEQDVIKKYREILLGKIMNTGEQRQVLHHLTRGKVLNKAKIEADGEDKEGFYQSQLEKIQSFSFAVRNHAIVGSTGKPFDTVIQIGIGGSDLGPEALYMALERIANPSLRAKFISNVDPDDASKVLSGVNFETTLFILVSKSGTTLETLTNKQIVMDAIKDAKIPGMDPSKHFVAVTSKTSPLAGSTDILDVFFIDDYIGGRYSSTSAVGGVVLSLTFGFKIFKEILDGAHEADIAALNPIIKENASLMDALIGIYLRNVLNYPYTAVLPYSQALNRFPAHLQQLDMESNGKHVNRFAKSIDYSTGPVVFGEPGTNGQHSFYQLLHQGTDIVPLQFIGFKFSQIENDVITKGSTSQAKLNANLAAQIVAFARGQEDKDKNKNFEGNRVSSIIIGRQLTPKILGSLLAHFENKVMFQGFVWNLNSFDQEGVQLGKRLANKVLEGCEDDEVLYSYASLLK
ncbi:MAG: glucose-6-phosphate isomerase [Sphaerochaetaceae bacterium]|nr:glucose-6-phosphate isomerase [Sphaerochaetaceae bacterium]